MWDPDAVAPPSLGGVYERQKFHHAILTKDRIMAIILTILFVAGLWVIWS